MSDTKRRLENDRYAVELDTSDPMVLLADATGYDRWLEDGEEFLLAVMEEKSLSEDEALEAINRGSTWAFFSRVN